MSLWWVANIVLILVVIPVVIAILIQVLIPLVQIKKYADHIIEAGATFPPNIDEIAGELVRTRELVTVAGPEIARYSRAVDNL